MKLPLPANPAAWQPLTPRGVAAFARASWPRLIFVQILFAIFAAACVVWFVDSAWSPVIERAIRRLPERGEIRAGKLDWSGDSAEALADSRFLSLAVDLNHSGGAHAPADVQVEFGRRSFFMASLLGHREFAYPADRVLMFNRSDLIPWWGAWRPPILWITFAVVFAWCLASWTALATIYFAPVWVAAFFVNRNLSARGSWKLSGAALMPGALLMSSGVLAYGFGVLDLVQLAVVTALHLVVGWIYLILSVASVPKLGSLAVAPENPFTTPALGASRKPKSRH